MSRTNSLQAILTREAAEPAELAAEPQPKVARSRQRKPAPGPVPAPAAPKAFHRPSRDGKRFLGGHFSPEVARQIKMLAVEDDTTTQALLEEALNLLFVKKGRGKIIGV